METENDFRFNLADMRVKFANILDALVAAGYSNTQARRAVVTALCESTGQVSPADLLALGRDHHPNLGLVTVYRTLDILSSLGLVSKLHTQDGCHTYALASQGHAHHVICRRCERVLEFEGCDISEVVSTVERQTGFKVSDHWLEMFGLCPDCQHVEMLG